MGEKRNHQRIACAEKCYLYYADSTYSGAIMNISISGALVTLYGSPPDAIMPGDECSLVLSNKPGTSVCRYKSQITRVSSAGLGLAILEHEF